MWVHADERVPACSEGEGSGQARAVKGQSGHGALAGPHGDQARLRAADAIWAGDLRARKQPQAGPMRAGRVREKRKEGRGGWAGKRAKRGRKGRGGWADSWLG